MAGSAFDVEQLRLAAARGLPASCHDDFLRLSRTLVHGPAFQWLLVDAPDENLRKQVMTALDEVLRMAGLNTSRLPVSDRIADVAELEERLIKNARAGSVVHVVGRPGWFDSARWDAFNARRERLASQARARLVFWLDADAIALASSKAPDLWAWRSGVYAFLPPAAPATSAPAIGSSPELKLTSGHVSPIPPRPTGADNRSMAERSRRVAEIRAWLANKPAPPDELLAAPVDELGRLLHDLGDYDAALQHWREVELPLHRRLGDERAEAMTKGQIADILQARGQLDEALRIRREEQLPVYERLGDVRSKAVTTGKIADILQARGQLDEALRIRKEEQLSVYERLGDVRAKAVTMGKIADILQARGQFDEALRIRREEQMPVYERLGDALSKAVTVGKIANILRTRGQLDEALRIYREEQLPVFERLGDIRSKAVTMGQIADILQDRGQFDEALRIRREEQMPVFMRLGDVREQAVTMGQIADILQDRGQLGEALRIRKEEELPVYDRLGEVRGKAITSAKIGLHLLDGEGATADEARQLLETAWAELSRLGLPEADALAEQMRMRGLKLPATHRRE
ncbi:tetratricopeptide repeat protein [Ideonella azotifigens]|uniref:Tetratricopeptide repeat protein n=1 Tax=Ideonella azotifigens TaxID=513160 RepID=A0ABN1JJZ3_9BURK|nr:tetratricopeptide repeat protein [Ideonella azotifigens]MCD2341912.1 tetratricopeptide repeat protein [Ideonella azotifigens]